MNAGGTEMTKTGTLKELNVKPGDVVECTAPYGQLWGGERVIGDGPSITDNEGDTWGRCDGAWTYELPECADFRIISRASDTPKTWGEMTDAEKGALLLHEYENGNFSIQYGHSMTDTWGTKHIHEPYQNDTRYRIKPEPKRETVTYRGSIPNTPNVWAFHRTEFGTDTHRVIFDLIDGEPITGVFTNENGDVIKMEKVK